MSQVLDLLMVILMWVVVVVVFLQVFLHWLFLCLKEYTDKKKKMKKMHN